MKNILWILFLISSLFCNAQQNTFTKTISIDSVDVLPAGSCKGNYGCYFIYGYTLPYPRSMWLIKFNNNDDTLFTAIIENLAAYSNEGSKTLTATFDGGCVLLGTYGGGDLYFIKLDSLGTISYQKIFGTSSLAGINKVIQTRDSGYVVMFPDNIISPQNGYGFHQLIKIDQYGDTIWWRELRDGTGQGDIVENENGDLFVTCENGVLYKFDLNGNRIWVNLFPLKEFGEIIGIENNILYAKAFSYYYPDTTFIFKLDTNGTFLNAYYFQNNSIMDADILSTHEFAITLKETGTLTSVLLLDTNFQPTYRRTFLLPMQYSKLVETDNKSLVICGGINNTLSGKTTAILSLDSLGNNFCIGDTGSISILTKSVDYELDTSFVQYQNNNLYSTFTSHTYSINYGIQIVTDCISNDIENISQRNHFSIFPNPTKGSSTIYSEGSEEKSISVFDLTGKQLFNSNNIKFPYLLNLENYTSGMYFIKLYNEKEVIVLRIILE